AAPSAFEDNDVIAPDRLLYKLCWKLSSVYPMTAPSYSERRSQFAKSIGLGRGPAQRAVKPAAASTSETTPEKSARRRSAGNAKKASTKKTNSRTSPTKATRTRISAKKTSPRTSPKK